jgi:hypothetical protein
MHLLGIEHSMPDHALRHPKVGNISIVPKPCDQIRPALCLIDLAHMRLTSICGIILNMLLRS